MSDPGRNVTTNTGFDSFESYSYPDPVCWKQTTDLEIDEKNCQAAQSKSAKDIKQIAAKTIDIHNDGRPDLFRLVETENLFLVFLHRGYTYMNAWGNCGGGKIMEDGIEEKGQLVGTIAKSRATQRTVTQLGLQSKQEGPQKFYQVVVTGAEILGGKKQSVNWIFNQVACPIGPVHDLNYDQGGWGEHGYQRFR